MKKQKLLLIPLLGIFILTMVSCQKKPDASFTASKTTVAAGELVVFTNTSKDGHDFEWNFGDNATSTAENPTHIYNSTGTFNVVMTALSKNGKKSDDASCTIFVTGGNITYANNNYSLGKGYLVYEGTSSGYNIFGVLLAGNGISFTEADGISGTGSYIILDNVCSNSMYNLPSGTYTYAQYYWSYAFLYGEVGFDYNWDIDDGIAYECTGGTAVISFSGTEYTLNMTLALETGNTAIGNFKGPLEYIDMSGKQAHNIFRRK
jgi:PKD repeat protein